MFERTCVLDHDCDSNEWHLHRFADGSGSIRWSTDEMHLATRVVTDLLVDLVEIDRVYEEQFAPLDREEQEQLPPDPLFVWDAV